MAYKIQDDKNPNFTTFVDATDDGLGLMLRHQEDVTDILDYNKRIKAEIGKGIPKNHDEPRFVGRLSGFVLAEAMRQGLISVDPDGDHAHIVDQKKFRKWLNDRDNRAWRGSEGKV